MPPGAENARRHARKLSVTSSENYAASGANLNALHNAG
jgi:hypothetical protein